MALRVRVRPSRLSVPLECSKRVKLESSPTRVVDSRRTEEERGRRAPRTPTDRPTDRRTGRDVCLEQTNRPVRGLVSIDRSKVAALLSTTPRPRPKSSTNDLVLDLDTVNSRFTTMPDLGDTYAGRNEESSYRGYKSTPSAEARSTRLYRCLPTVRGHEVIVACLGGILT